MISIIICSRKPDISTQLRDNIQSTIGVKHEIIVIDNSENRYSIFSAYNKGAEKCNYPYLCFIHDDILFRTQDWGNNLIKHLDDKQTGLVGIAGGIMMTKVPAPSWPVGEKLKHIVQHRKSKQIYYKLPENTSIIHKKAILLDGVFLGIRRDTFQQLQFDDTFSGFHGYDLDISVQSIVAGYKNFVIYDILLEHFSQGDGNASYYTNLLKIYNKWEPVLPLFAENNGLNEFNINQIQYKNLIKIIRRLARTGFTTKDIIRIANYYSQFLQAKEAARVVSFIRLKIFIERLFNSRSN